MAQRVVVCAAVPRRRGARGRARRDQAAAPAGAASDRAGARTRRIGLRVKATCLPSQRKQQNRGKKMKGQSRGAHDGRCRPTRPARGVCRPGAMGRPLPTVCTNGASCSSIVRESRDDQLYPKLWFPPGCVSRGDPSSVLPAWRGQLGSPRCRPPPVIKLGAVLAAAAVATQRCGRPPARRCRPACRLRTLRWYGSAAACCRPPPSPSRVSSLLKTKPRDTLVPMAWLMSCRRGRGAPTVSVGMHRYGGCAGCRCAGGARAPAGVVAAGPAGAAAPAAPPIAPRFGLAVVNAGSVGSPSTWHFARGCQLNNN